MDIDWFARRNPSTWRYLSFGTLLVGLLLVPAQAQGSIEYGIKGGLSQTSGGIRPISRLGANAGVFVSAPVRTPFNVMLGIDFHYKGLSRKGVEIADEFGNTSSDPMYRYGYISALSAFHYQSALSGVPFESYFFLGPRVDVLAFREFTHVVERERVPLERESDALKSAILGFSGGLGLDFTDVSRFPILVELRYNGDLTFAYESAFAEQRNRTVDLRVGLTF